MKIRESNLWAWLRKSWKSNRLLHAQRIENSTATGTPDVEISYGRTSFWVELKALHRPAREDTPIDTELTYAQGLWHRRRYEVGGTSFILIAIGARNDRSMYLLPGNLALDLIDNRVPEWHLGQLSLCQQDASPVQLLDAMTIEARTRQ